MSAIIRLRPDVAWQVVDGEVVALDLAAAAYLMANGSGSLLWPLVAEGATPARLVEELTGRFAVDAEQARSDVEAFVDQLRTLGLLGEPAP